MIRPAFAVIRRRPWPIAGTGWLLLPFAVAASFCIIGIPFAVRLLRTLALETLRAAHDIEGSTFPSQPRPEKSYAGSIAFAGAVAFGTALELVLAATSHVLGSGNVLVALTVSLGVGGLAIVVVATALAPLLLAPFCAIAGAGGVLAPFSRSFEIAARRGAKATLRLGVTVGGFVALAFVLVGLLFFVMATRTRLDTLYIAAVATVVLTIPVVFAGLASMHARHGYELQSERPVRARLRGLAWLLAPAFAAFAVTFIVAGLTPSPMRPIANPPEVVRGFHAFDMTLFAGAGRIPGTSVRLRIADDGIVVETDDGGGAGAIDSGLGTRPEAFYVRERVVGERRTGEYVVVVTGDERWVSTTVDSDGVRLDDSMAARTFGRLGQLGSIGLAVALLLLLYLSFTLGAELGSARTLSAPALLDEGGERDGGLRALEATLRISDESKVLFKRAFWFARVFGNDAGRLVVEEGEAWLEADGGALRFRLPARPITVLGGASAQDWNGEHVVLLSRFEAGVTTGLRESAVAFPKDGRLTLGTPDDASDVLIAGAVRRASFIVVPVLAGLFSAAAALLLAL